MRQLLTLILFFLLSSCRTEKEMHIIPRGYVGWVVIAFKQKDGVNIVRKNGFRVYEIPENGVLKVKEDSNDGVFEESDILFLQCKGDNSYDTLKFFTGWITENRFKKQRIELEPSKVIVQAPGVLGGEAVNNSGGYFYFVGQIKDSMFAEKSYEAFLIKANNIIK